MTSASAAARRPSRSVWSDTRFLLGLVLVVASVAGVWAVVALARQTQQAVVAARTIVPGDVVSSGDLRIVDVALGTSDDAYLAPEGVVEGLVATRTIGADELVARDAVGSAAAAGLARVVVSSGQAVSGTVREGSTVELWAAAPRKDGGFEAPRILVADAVVAAIASDDAVMSQVAATIELVIPRSDTAETLAAAADGSQLSVVETAGAAR